MKARQPSNELAEDDPRHGTIYGYTTLKCRCVPCTEANTEACRRSRFKRLELPVPAKVHGTVNAYNGYGCRCDLCKEAHRIYYRRYNKTANTRK
jgi:hypothetical protein